MSHTNNTKAAASSNRLFPIFLKTDRLSILLVGAGPVGREKLQAILAQEPESTIHVVASTIAPETRALCASYHHVRLSEEAFAPAHLDGTHLVIAAVNDRATSERIHALARERHIPVNVADTPDLCDFYLGAIVRKGDLKIAISTNGKSPTIAKRLRELLQAELPDGLDSLLQNMNALREHLRGDFAAKVKALDHLTRDLSRAGVPIPGPIA